MVDTALVRLWTTVRSDFERARDLLPSPPAEAEGSAARLVEWLDNNELELALDELEALGEDNASPSAYWEHLRSAAERMSLTEHLPRLTSRMLLALNSESRGRMIDHDESGSMEQKKREGYF